MVALRDVATPRKYTNQTLVRGIEQGDAHAASAFFKRFGKRIGALVWTMMGGDAEHSDVVQTVYVNIIQSIGSLRDSDKLPQWVDSVVYRVVCKELRKRKRSKLVYVDIQSDTFENNGRHGNTSIATIRLFLILDKMETDARMFFSMKYLDKMSLAEMATVSGRSVSTIKRRVTHARRVFEDLVNDDLVLQADLEGHSHVYRWCS